MTPRQMAMLDACDRYVVGLATAYERYDRTPAGGERYCEDIAVLGRDLGQDVRTADRVHPTDAAS